MGLSKWPLDVMDPSRSSESYPLWRINWNCLPSGTYTPCFTPVFSPHISKRTHTVPTSPDPHLTLSQEKPNTKSRTSGATDVMEDGDNCNTSLNGRDTRKVITPGSQLIKSTPLNW